MSHTIERILVVGAGTMGTQIASVFARSGFMVTVADVEPAALERSADEARGRLLRLGEKGLLDDPESALSRVTWTSRLEDAARNSDLVVEAVSEHLELKRHLFRTLGQIVPEHTLLTTNSSTIPSSKVADASGHADRVCNMHFFNPALVMQCVEVVPNPDTSPATMDAVLGVVERLGKTAIRLSREVPGFIANRLMNAIQDEAIRLYAEGYASIEDIDRAANLALGHPLGPFQLMDLVGLDVIQLIHVADADLSEDPSRLPPPALTRLVNEGRLGRKNGRGWYEYAGAGS